MKNKKASKMHLYKFAKTYDGKYFITACGRYIKGRLIGGNWFLDDGRMTTDIDVVTCLQCKNRRVVKDENRK